MLTSQAFVTLVCWIFKRIDERWQAEAEGYRARTELESRVPTFRCWVFNDCPEAKREICRAYQEQNFPCWQHFRAKNGALQEKCIGCGVFRGAPAPATGD